jgi:hypothetical protein
MRRWQKSEAAVPLSERIIYGIMWAAIIVLIAMSQGYQGTEWFFALAVILVFPGLPLVLGIFSDYTDAKDRLKR